MGFWNWLISSIVKDQSVGMILGTGKFLVQIVGESKYQRNLNRMCGGKTFEGHNFSCTAILIPENKNRHDKNAVRVEIKGKTVGYLDRYMAKNYRRYLQSNENEGAILRVGAVIRGGWKRSQSDEGFYGVRLDLQIL